MYLSTLAGAVTVNGQGVSDTDKVVVNDQVSTLSGAYTLTSSTLSRTNFAGLTCTGIEQMTLDSESGNYTINVTSTTSGVPVTINAGGGNTIQLGSGDLSKLAAGVTVNGKGGTDRVFVNDQSVASSNNYTITDSIVGRVSFGGLTYSGIQSLTLNADTGGNTINVTGSASGIPVTINAGGNNNTINVGNGDLSRLAGAVMVNDQGNGDRVNINDQSASSSNAYTITSSTVSRGFFGGLTYGKIAGLILNAESGNNTISVVSTAPGVGPQRLVVEVPVAVVRRPAARGAVLEQVDGGERLQQVAVAEDHVLVVARALLTVEVDVEELVRPQRLRDAVGVVEAGHLLVADLGVDADHVGVLALVDEGERVPDRRQQDVAAGLVRLRLDREAHVVALVDRVLREHVDALAVTVERRPDVLGEVDLGALAAAPEDVDLRAELGREVHVPHDLAQRVAADRAVVAGEAAVLEDGVAEQVGRDHRHDETGLGQRALELTDDRVALGAAALRRDEVVVVERDAVRTELGELVHGRHAGHHGAGGLAEQVARLPADGPQTEAELVFTGGDWGHGASPGGGVDRLEGGRSGRAGLARHVRACHQTRVRWEPAFRPRSAPAG